MNPCPSIDPHSVHTLISTKISFDLGLFFPDAQILTFESVYIAGGGGDGYGYGLGR